MLNGRRQGVSETKVDEGGQTAGGILVADGKVITNRTCINGVRAKCFIAAHDAKTGHEVWRFYTTAAQGESGGDTWADMPTELRAASPWGCRITYAVNGKQYVMIFTGEGQSVSSGPLSLTQKSMAKAVRGHNSIFVFALP